MRRLRSALLVVALVIASAEFACFLWEDLVSRSGWRPHYAQGSVDMTAPWLTEDQPWGAWHHPNVISHQQKACFSVSLRSNSFGARDRERDLDGSPHRTIVLGDSFVEGLGVEAAERVSDLLELRLKREFLNFGAQYDFGPLQYQIIYDRLASRFSHDQVLILFLPDNDFTDNDLEWWRRYRLDFNRRYRPYYQAVGDGYAPYYPVPNPKDAAAHAAPPGLLATIGDTIIENSWIVAAYRDASFSHSRPAHYSGYFDFTDAQLKAVLWSFVQIKKLAGERNVTIAIIPRRSDFARVAAEGNNRLGDIMKRFGAENGIDIVDLLPLMPAIEPDTEKLFLPCDGHWSALGNRVAADVLEKALHF
ncbi:MAG TPA: hypothetical protein VGR70_01785 [Stellaceae bacterium]|nr:hypothetical protein [Stellaceae bacterium]